MHVDTPEPLKCLTHLKPLKPLYPQDTKPLPPLEPLAPLEQMQLLAPLELLQSHPRSTSESIGCICSRSTEFPGTPDASYTYKGDMGTRGFTGS